MEYTVLKVSSSEFDTRYFVVHPLSAAEAVTALERAGFDVETVTARKYQRETRVQLDHDEARVWFFGDDNKVTHIAKHTRNHRTLKFLCGAHADSSDVHINGYGGEVWIACPACQMRAEEFGRIRKKRGEE